MATLTKPQKALKEQLDNGRTFATFNAHHASGGEYRFTDNGELVSYKVFGNMQYALGANKFDKNKVHIGSFNCDFMKWKYND